MFPPQAAPATLAAIDFIKADFNAKINSKLMANRFSIISLGIFLIIFSFLFFGNESHAQECQLLSATWNKQIASVGEPVTLVVNGQNCSGLDVSLDIYENDTGPNDVLLLKIGGKFTTGGTNQNAVAIYTFTTSDYQNGGNESARP